MKKLISKIILAIFVVSTMLTPFAVHAQLSALTGGIPVNATLNGEVPGVLGGISGATSAVSSVGATTCAISETITTQVASIISRGLSLLGDNTAQVVDLQAQLAIVDGAIACWSGVVTSASVSSTFASGTLFGFTKANATRDQALAQISSFKQIKKQLEARIQIALQSFWKAVFVGVLLRQTDHLSEKLVSELTEKFKINNYSQYIGAAADTVYTNSMIMRYVDNDKDRAIVRSMIKNPFLREKIHPAIQASADAYVGFDPKNVSFADPKFVQAVGKLASGEEYKQLYQSAMITKTDEIIAKAREAAVSEVGQSGGYKSTLNNCGPSISAQKQKDLEYKAILDEIKDRETLGQRINAYYQATEEERNKIDKDIKAARTKLEKFTDNLGPAVMHICEGTNTPAAKFKDTIHDLIGTQIANFKDYNDNNLPLLQKLVVELADNLINKFVFGTNRSSTGDLIRESIGDVTNGVAASLQKPSNGLNTTLPTPTFTSGEPAPTPGNVAGDETTTPSVQVLPRGPALTFR